MAEAGKIDPMHQFTVEPLVPLQLGGYDISFTNSSLLPLTNLPREVPAASSKCESRS